MPVQLMTVSVVFEIFEVPDSVEFVGEIATKGSKRLLHEVLSNNTQMRVAKAARAR